MTRSTVRPARRSKRSMRRIACAASASASSGARALSSSSLTWSLPWQTSESRSRRCLKSETVGRCGRPASSGIIAIEAWYPCASACSTSRP